MNLHRIPTETLVDHLIRRRGLTHLLNDIAENFEERATKERLAPGLSDSYKRHATELKALSKRVINYLTEARLLNVPIEPKPRNVRFILRRGGWSIPDVYDNDIGPRWSLGPIEIARVLRRLGHAVTIDVEPKEAKS